MRYRLYGEWEKEDEQIPMVLAARQTAKVHIYIRLESPGLSEYACIYSRTISYVATCKFDSLKASLVCLFLFLFVVGHKKNFETACKRKFEAAGSDGCKISSRKSNDCTKNNCSSGLILLMNIPLPIFLESSISFFLAFEFLCTEVLLIS